MERLLAPHPSVSFVGVVLKAQQVKNTVDCQMCYLFLERSAGIFCLKLGAVRRDIDFSDLFFLWVDRILQIEREHIGGNIDSPEVPVQPL